MLSAFQSVVTLVCLLKNYKCCASVCEHCSPLSPTLLFSVFPWSSYCISRSLAAVYGVSLTAAHLPEDAADGESRHTRMVVLDAGRFQVRLFKLVSWFLSSQLKFADLQLASCFFVPCIGQSEWQIISAWAISCDVMYWLFLLTTGFVDSCVYCILKDKYFLDYFFLRAGSEGWAFWEWRRLSFSKSESRAQSF